MRKRSESAAGRPASNERERAGDRRPASTSFFPAAKRGRGRESCFQQAVLILIFACIFLVAAVARPAGAASWSGVDETVIEKVAEEAGRTAREPLINTDQGDLLLFVFLVAGMVGGFIGGYNFRTLFPPKRRKEAG